MKNNIKDKKWYKLDAFAKTYSSIISEGRTTCFRLSVLFTENVDVVLLKKVTLFLGEKYPFYNSEMKKGIFWNYLQHKKTPITVVKEKTYPCTNVNPKKPLRILYYKNKLSIEIAHFLTDGIGASIFFKDLIETYLQKKYFHNLKSDFQRKNELGKDEIIKEKEEYVDLYSKYMKKVNKENTIKKAFHFPIKIEEKGQYFITTGELDINDIKREAKKYETTIGKYLLAIYFKILLDKYPNVKDQFVIGVPVDLRNIYDEKTYRNFFINITPTIDSSLGEYSVEEIVKYLNLYFELKITKKEFYKSIYKAMNPIKNIFIKIVPNFIKKIFIPFIFDYYGEKGYTSGFSNLGIFKIEEKYEKFLKGYRFLPPPSKRCKIKVGLISDKNKIYISFGNLTTNHEIERDYFVYLRKRGIKSKIITNYK